MANETAELRAFKPNEELVAELLAAPLMTGEERADLFVNIPRGLSTDAVDKVGIQAYNLGEKLEDRWNDGCSRERQAVFWLGRTSLEVDQDVVTATHAAEHLRLRGGFVNRWSALLLQRRINKVAKSGK